MRIFSGCWISIILAIIKIKIGYEQRVNKQNNTSNTYHYTIDKVFTLIAVYIFIQKMCIYSI